MNLIQAIYEDTLIGKTICFIYKAHNGQTDKGGVPYIFHPLQVASNVGEDRECVLAALLHDVLEDTAYTRKEILALGIPERVVKALELLTHDASMPYMEYIRRLKTDPISAAVKKADLKHNMDLGRLPAVTKKDRNRQKKYQEAYRLLTSE